MSEITQEMQADNRSIAYMEDRVSIYRASGLGSCLSAVVAAMLGHKEARGSYQQGIMSNAAREGSMHEPHIVEMMEAGEVRAMEPMTFVDLGQTQVELKIMPRVIVRGHTDGIGKQSSQRKNRVVEIKTMSKERFKDFERLTSGKEIGGFEIALTSDDFLTYGWQISIYMLSTGLPATYVVKNRDSGKIIWAELTTPPITLKAIRKKVILAEKWRKREEVPPCQGSSTERFFCPFPKFHDIVADEEEVPDLTVSLEDSVMLGMLEMREDFTKTMSLGKAAEEKRKDLNARIQELMEGDKVQVGPYVVSKTTNKGRANLDPAALAHDLNLTFTEMEVLIETNSKRIPFTFITVKKATK